MTLWFLICDIGAIRDEGEFRRDLEATGNTSVLATPLRPGDVGCFHCETAWSSATCATNVPGYSVRCVVSGGGLSADACSWHSTKRRGFLFPVKALSKLFRGKYLAALDRLQRTGAVRLAGQSTRFSATSNWVQLLAELRRTTWVVYAKPPFGVAACVLKYLSRYTHRVAISNRRLLFVGDGVVRFTWKDYADHNATKEMTLRAEEFLRRFLLHVVPRGFMRIRHYGILANRHRAQKLRRCRELLGVPTRLPPQEPLTLPDRDPHRDAPDEPDTERSPTPCPNCGAPMRVVEILAPRPWDTS